MSQLDNLLLSESFLNLPKKQTNVSGVKYIIHVQLNYMNIFHAPKHHQ